MAQFIARQLKKGWFEIQGLEKFIEAKLKELRSVLRDPKTPPRPAPRAAPLARAVAQNPVRSGTTPLELVLAAYERHPQRDALARAGREKNQLLRSLIPLYVGRGLEVEITSGVMSSFWKALGVRYAAPNAAKALRQHKGYAKLTKQGRKISPAGLRYVEAALKQAG